MTNWDNDTAAQPGQPTWGADDLSDDDGSWFEPVSYDQTEYQDLDAYLEQAGDLDREAAQEPPRYLDDTIVGGMSAHDGAVSEASADDYAGYDEYAYLGAHEPPAAYPEAYEEAPAAYPGAYEAPDGDAWQDRPRPEDRWTPPAAVPQQPRPYGQQGGQQGGQQAHHSQSRLTGIFHQAYSRRRPRWVIGAFTAVAAAALGAGVIVVTHTGDSSLPSSALPQGTAPPGGGAPVLIRPATPAASGPAVTAPASPGGTTGGASTGATAPGTLQPPVTPAQARQVLAAYTAANNTANAQASQSSLTAVETGSSLAIDSGVYQGQKAGNGAPFPAFGPVTATYYIPLESPAAYPRWFAVHVRNAFLSDPGTIISGEYLVFTQASPGAPWLEQLEPYIVRASAEPAIALDANGYATATTPGDANLVLSPAAASGATATAFDSGGQPASPGTLAAGREAAVVGKQVPPGTVTAIRHAGTTDPVFGLRTADGGALLFYDIGAKLTVTAPAGSTLSGLNVPGFVSPGGQATSVTLDFLEQFATYDPARGHGTLLPIVADYSGITAQG